MVREDIVIDTTNKEKLKGFILRGENTTPKSPVIIVIHGWLSEAGKFASRVESLVDLGYTCVLFDLRGHGETGYALAQYSRQDHLDDCIAVYDFVQQLHRIDTENISLYGASYGGYLACLVSRKRAVKNLMLLVPAQYQDEYFYQPQLDQDQDERMEYRRQHHTPQDNVMLAALAQYQGNVLLVEAEFDEYCPPQIGEDIASVVGEKIDRVTVKGADHHFRNGNADEERIEIIKKWFGRWV